MTDERINSFRLQFDDVEDSSAEVKDTPTGPRPGQSWTWLLLISVTLVSQFPCLWVFMVADQPEKRREALGIIQSKESGHELLIICITKSEFGLLLSKVLPKQVSLAGFADLEYSPPSWFFRLAWYSCLGAQVWNFS